MTYSKTPTPEQVSKAVATLVRSTHRSYFFDSLDNPNWIEPLRDQGLFREPPPAVRDEKQGTIGFPPWPQSRYLARMASVAPEVVLETILKIPETDNTRILDDFIGAALHMPANVAAKLVPAALKWLDRPPFIQLPLKFGRLVEHLARGGQHKTAIKLARSLLSVIPGRGLAVPSEDAEPSFRREPRGRFDAWEYEQILKTNIPSLVNAAPSQTHSMLCDLLEGAVRLSRVKNERSAEDISHVWRPAIEEHGQNLGRDIREALVVSVRDASETLAAADPKWVSTLVRSFRKRRLRIFLRLAHHLLRQHPTAAPNLVERTLSSYGLFERARLWHEYALLLRTCFASLPGPAQQRILGWVSEGPDLAGFRERYQQLLGRPATDSEESQYVKVWQRDHLALISESLREPWSHEYRELVRELGPADFPEFGSHIEGGAWGFQSPRERSHLAQLSPQGLVDFLRSWEPPKDVMGPSREGLGRDVQSLVAKDPEKFATAATEFVGLDPTYVRALLDGLNAAVKQGTSFSWPSVLALCAWVVEQERDIKGRKGDFGEQDPDWGWTRTAIVRLLGLGMEAKPSLISSGLRHAVWAVLRPLTDDPNPQSDDEDRYGAPNIDAQTLSINTTRGEAMHTVVKYALWVRRQVESEKDSASRLASGFEQMLEVREVLDRHLDPANDSSLAIRSVYGQWLPWLVLLDKAWVQERLGKMFPADAASKNLRDACWDAYVISSKPYDNVLEVVRAEYTSACDRIGDKRNASSHLGDPDERLAEHLMVFYWRAKLDLTGSESLLERFYSRASDALRGRALLFVGMSLRNTKDEIPKVVLDRLVSLWAHRLEAALKAESRTPNSLEMAAFGWWFASGRFDDAWSLAQLLEVLRLTGKVEVDHLVVERLAALAARFPEQVVNCFRLMVEGGKDGWAIGGWIIGARDIFESVLKCSDENAKQLAVGLIHRFGELGYFDFRDLLPEGQSIGPAGETGP